MEGKEKKHFIDISPKSWEHPADHAALLALKQIPGLDELIRQFVGRTTEKSLKLISLASSVRISEKQFSKVFGLLEDACTVLDVNP
ncbi:MAG: Zn-dependent protease with chaperone function, partial [Spirochaetota bacterium]